MVKFPPAIGAASIPITLAIAGVIGSNLLQPAAVLAQITSDETLGDERSTLRRDTERGIDVIEGGATRGANLFHSFEQFNVDEGRRAYFANPDGIANIFSRVTGRNASNIRGTLGVSGEANLFLLNPQGILFGPNAQLDVRGSFLATTADAIQFGNQGFFSAVNPAAPPLLTVDPSAFLFNQIQRGDIVSRSIAPAGVDPIGRPALGLRVGDGAMLSLLGGNVKVEGGRLNAFGGRVNIGAVEGVGTIALNDDGSLDFPDKVGHSDVSLTNRATINTAAGEGGDIAITAHNISLSGGSTITTGILPGLGREGARSGSIRLNATGSIQLRELSSILNRLEGRGRGGNIAIQASETVRLDGSDRSSNPLTAVHTEVRTGVVNGAVGDAGEVRILARNLFATNGARILTGTSGRGNAGNIRIRVSDDVVLSGTGLEEVSPGLFRGDTIISSSVQKGSTGDGGLIQITARSISITNGGVVGAATSGRGDGGDVVFHIAEQLSFNDGSVLTQVQTDGIGNGGDIRMSAPLITMSGLSSLSASNVGGVGDSGNLYLTALRLSLTRGSQIGALTIGQGDAGNIVIRAQDSVVLDGAISSLNPYTAGISTTASQDATVSPVTGLGQAGNIRIDTSRLWLGNGAFIEATNTTGRGGGNITIDADSLAVVDGGLISTRTSSTGQAGDITLNIAGELTLSGRDSQLRKPRFDRERLQEYQGESGIFANTRPGSTGNGGNILVTAGEVRLDDGGRMAASSQSSGEAGSINLQSNSLVLTNQAQLSAETATSAGGNVALKLRDLLLLRDRSNITTEAGTAQAGGNGGNITIATPFIVAPPFEDSNINANAFRGNGGNITITTQSLLGLQASAQPTPLSDITASSQFGLSGQISITAPEVNPTQGLVELPTTLIDPAQQIAQSCTADRNQAASEFVVSGRGGLPASPLQMSSGDVVVSRLAVLADEAQALPDQTADQGRQGGTPARVAIVEAQGWVVDEAGNIVLIAQGSAVTPHSLAFQPMICSRG